MNVIVGKDLRITEYSKEFLREISSVLTFTNPDYIKKQRLGKWLGSTPKYLELFELNRETLVVPFGMLGYVYSKKTENDIFIPQFESNLQKIDYKSKIKPFDYQEPAIEAAVKYKQGVLIAPCGSGKTQIGLEIIARLGKPTLWLTHTEDLLKQSFARALSVFGLPEKYYGTITGGKVNIGRAITFATVQTMVSLDLAKYENEWDVIVVDECHHVAGTPTRLMMFYKVITSLCARHKFGLTATAQRTDGLERCMFCLLGSKVHEISRDKVACNTCPVDVVPRETGFEPDYDEILGPDGTIDYHLLIHNIIADQQRNLLIADDVEAAEGTCLVLTNRIEHIERLADIFQARHISFKKLLSNSSKKGKKDREQSISSLKEGKIKVLIATFQLAQEGLDIPSLRNVFFTTPVKNEITMTQSAGRVARKSEGKEKGVVYDYVDNFILLENYYKIRCRIFDKLGYNLHEIH